MADLRELYANYVEQTSSGSVLLVVPAAIAEHLTRAFGLRELRLVNPGLARAMGPGGGEGGATTPEQQRQLQYQLQKLFPRAGAVPFSRLGMPRKLYAEEEGPEEATPAESQSPPPESLPTFSAKLASLSERRLSVSTVKLRDRAPVRVDISGLDRATGIQVIARYWLDTSAELQAQISLSKFDAASDGAFRLSAREILERLAGQLYTGELAPVTVTQPIAWFSSCAGQAGIISGYEVPLQKGPNFFARVDLGPNLKRLIPRFSRKLVMFGPASPDRLRLWTFPVGTFTLGGAKFKDAFVGGRMKEDQAGRHDLWVTIGARANVLGKLMYVASGLVDDNGVLVFRVKEVSARAPRSSLGNLKEHFGNRTDWLDAASGATAFFGTSLIDQIQRFRLTSLDWTYDLGVGHLASASLSIAVSNTILLTSQDVEIVLDRIELTWLVGVPESDPRPVSFEGACRVTIGRIRFGADLVLRDGSFVLEGQAAGDALGFEDWTGLMGRLHLALTAPNPAFAVPSLYTLTLAADRNQAFVVDNNEEMLEWQPEI